jgi:hypothetical protein
MLDQEFKSAAGFKVRTIEAEAAGGLVEIDLRDLKATSDGTFLMPSKDLQAAGKWAFTLDVAQAKKEGKPVSPEDEKNIDPWVLLLNEFMQKLPLITKSIGDLKNARPHPIQAGLDRALSEEVAKIAQEILEENRTMKERLHEMVEQYLETNLPGPGEEEDEQNDGE